jgi:hypothetical protein
MNQPGLQGGTVLLNGQSEDEGDAMAVALFAFLGLPSAHLTCHAELVPNPSNIVCHQRQDRRPRSFQL